MQQFLLICHSSSQINHTVYCMWLLTPPHSISGWLEWICLIAVSSTLWWTKITLKMATLTYCKWSLPLKQPLKRRISMKSLLVEIILVIPHYQTTGYPTTSECGITESNIFTESKVLTSCQSYRWTNSHWIKQWTSTGIRQHWGLVPAESQYREASPAPHCAWWLMISVL